MSTEKEDIIFLAGHKGLLGSAILKKLKQDNYQNVITADKFEVNLENQMETSKFVKSINPKFIILAAGYSGGIQENKSKPYDLIIKNLLIQVNIFKAIENLNVKKLLFFGSSCMYPKIYDKPIKESSLLKGEMENSSISYAMAKLAGYQMCFSFNKQYPKTQCITIIPNSVYGPNDNFNPETGHVLASLIYKFNEAKAKKLPYINLWGNGKPLREFIYCEDIADASVFLMNNEVKNNLPINVGSGEEISILNLANKISKLTHYKGKIYWDIEKPNGALRKVLDSSQIMALGWKPKISLNMGLNLTNNWFNKNKCV